MIPLESEMLSFFPFTLAITRLFNPVFPQIGSPFVKIINNLFETLKNIQLARFGLKR